MGAMGRMCNEMELGGTESGVGEDDGWERAEGRITEGLESTNRRYLFIFFKRVNLWMFVHRNQN